MQKMKSGLSARILGRYAFSMQAKLIVIFLVVKVIPLILLCLLAWRQFARLGEDLQRIAVSDSTKALNDSAVANIERMSTDAASRVADFLYSRDADVRYAAAMEPTKENFTRFLSAMRGQLIKRGTWELAPDGQSWASADGKAGEAKIAVSTNAQNNDMDGFHSVPATAFEYEAAPLYDEITFIGLDGREKIKVVAADSPKVHYPMAPAPKDVSKRENTYVRAEDYFQKLRELAPGEIYVSDVIGAYTASNYVGMYVPDAVGKAAADRGYDISYEPEEQAYAGAENPNGRRFEGIVRWATPVAGPDGKVAGYVTLALNHDHIMEFVDHLTPMDERYTALPSAFEGNYAFIWDYKCRSICHPRHHSIVGFDPETGDPAVPWLEESIYNAWQASGDAKWTDFAQGVPIFHEQSRDKRPAPALTKAGLVGLDGRYLNNAPQCTGWMDLTRDGGSGSFYILWSGLYKLNTAAAIPYYTGQYAPSEENGFSRRGFGFVAIGSGMEYFTAPARATEDKLTHSIDAGLRSTVMQLVVTTAVLTLIVVLVAVWMARHISSPIKLMAQHTSRLAIGDISHGGVLESAKRRWDEIGRLAQALDELTIASRDEVAMANAIAGGDYTRGIPLRSENDQIGKAFKAMLNVNKTTLSHVNRTVGRLGEGAEVVAGVSVSLSEGVETSQTVLREISDNVEEVNRQAGDNARHAEDANKLAVSSWNSASRGYTSVSELAGAMTEIQTAGKRIESVVKLIDDIAFQTNLLALNAAVEAARAGRHGRGFSVVADEVRNLSQRSAKAAHETGSMVSSMLGLMAEGANLAEHSDKEFQEIVQTTEEMTRLSESISLASRAQSDSILRIMDRLGRIGGVTDANSSYAQQIAAYAGDLSSQAEALRSMVSLFRIEQREMQGRAQTRAQRALE